MKTIICQKRCAQVLLLAVTFTLSPAATAEAKDREFSPLIKFFKTQYQARQRHGFWLGLVGLAVKVVRPAGVKSFKVAFFEQLNVNDNAHAAASLGSAMRSSLGREWQPLVRVASNDKNDKQGFVYARQDGKNVNLLIVALDLRQAFIAHVKINPETMMKWMEKPEIMGISLGANRDNNSSNSDRDDDDKNDKPDVLDEYGKNAGKNAGKDAGKNAGKDAEKSTQPEQDTNRP